MPYDHITSQLFQVLKSNTWLGNYLKSVRHVESRAAAARSCWSVTSKSLHPDVIKDPMHGSKRKPLNSISEEKRNSKTFLFLVSGRPTYKFNCTAIYRCYIAFNHFNPCKTILRPFSMLCLRILTAKLARLPLIQESRWSQNASVYKNDNFVDVDDDDDNDVDMATFVVVCQVGKPLITYFRKHLSKHISAI